MKMFVNCAEEEYHPATLVAMDYLRKVGQPRLEIHLQVFNDMGTKTMRRLHSALQKVLDGEPVSDREVMGLGLMIMEMEKSR